MQFREKGLTEQRLTRNLCEFGLAFRNVGALFGDRLLHVANAGGGLRYGRRERDDDGYEIEIRAEALIMQGTVEEVNDAFEGT